MDQNEKLNADLVYLNKFMNDLQKIKSNLEAKNISNTYEHACVDIFETVRSYCESQASKISEQDATLGKNIEAFSNQILKVIYDVNGLKEKEKQKQKYKVEMLDEILVSTAASKNELENQIEDLSSRKNAESAPPARERPNLRKIGDRPASISERSKDS